MSVSGSYTTAVVVLTSKPPSLITTSVIEITLTPTAALTAIYSTSVTLPIDPLTQTIGVFLPASVLAATVPLTTPTSATSSSATTTPSSSETGTSTSGVTGTGATIASTSSQLTLNVSSTSFPNNTTTSTGLPTNPGLLEPSSQGLAAGVVAGIAIACLIAGLVIGVVAAFFLLRKNRGSKGYRPAEAAVTHQGFEYEPKGAAGAVTPPPPGLTPAVASVRDNYELAHFLTAPASDNDLSRELQSLGYLVQQHVESNYHVKPIAENQGVLAEALHDIGQGDTAATVAPLAFNSETRHAAIQHTIASAIFTSLSFGRQTPVSMLPASAAAFAHEQTPIQHGKENSEVVLFAQNRWRQLTSFLLNTNRNDRTPLTPRPEAGQRASQLASSLSRYLRPFVDPSEATKQTTHLQQVIMECTKYGYVVFSQPGEYRFVFETHQRELVTHPGLELVRDEQGKRLSTPITILAPMVTGE
ncbi:hypothetical protein GQ53DRAFT_836811 [Thozetella sp. PMI_491]|nr:hypothetical protein GQ53DRAFT_836811 [Thozetella sp. PMI_491]